MSNPPRWCPGLRTSQDPTGSTAVKEVALSAAILDGKYTCSNCLVDQPIEEEGFFRRRLLCRLLLRRRPGLATSKGWPTEDRRRFAERRLHHLRLRRGWH